MSSHKTQQTLNLFQRLGMPYLFSAPASYKAVPVESVFMYLKLTDFRHRQLSQTLTIKDITHDKLSKKQLLISQVADFILNISDTKMKDIFYSRLKHLRYFLALRRV
jgi:hypothetical protein